MDADVMRRRVSEARVARLATVTPAGQPHLVPCTFAVDGDTLYTAVDDVKPKSSRSLQRLENIGAHPEVSVLVDHYEDDWSALWWVRLDGRAAIADAGSRPHDRGVSLLVDKYPRYAGSPPRGPAIVVEITRWRSWP